MRRLALLPLALLLACATARPTVTGPASRPASGEVVLEVGLPGRGALVLSVPPGWRVSTGDGEGPPTLRLEPPGRHQLLYLSTPWDPEEPDAPVPAEAAQRLAEAARDAARDQASEPELQLLALEGEAVRGWYFTASDRELATGDRTRRPDEYRCLVQGAAMVGGLLISFTALDDGDGPHRAEVLDLLRRLRHRPPLDAPPADEAAGPRPPRAAPPTTSSEPIELAWPGKAWAVRVALPGFALERRPDVGTISVVGQDARGVVASVILSEARGARSAVGCRERDWARIQAAAPELAEARPWAAGDRAGIDYLAETFQGRRVDLRHRSTWWYRDGVCVHLHVSHAGSTAGEGPALEALATGLSFVEPL